MCIMHAIPSTNPMVQNSALQLLSRTSHCCTKPDGSFPCSHVCQHWTLSSYMRNPVYTLTMYVRKIQLNIVLPTTSLSHIPLKFMTKILCAFISSPIHAKCPAHLILLNLITLVISGEEDQKVGNSFRPYATKVTQLTLLYQNYGHLLKSNMM